MFVVVYHWKLKAGCEERFREGWHRVTERLRAERGSLGSRLHACDDGTWAAYAQWPSAEHFAASSARGPLADEPGYAMMSESVEAGAVVSPLLKMTVVDDLLAK